MNKIGITPRERMDINEIVMFKSLCATKASVMKSLVQDEELKNMLQEDVNITKEILRDLKNLLESSSLEESEEM